MGGKQKPYEMWQAGNSLAASPLANSSRASPERNIAALPPLARSRIPPATQASRIRVSPLYGDVLTWPKYSKMKEICPIVAIE